MGGEAPSDARYVAFISYRHARPDSDWAKWLHRALETYRLPHRLARERGLPRALGRVFRDEDELHASSSLTAEIDHALQESKFLIVICSPRTPGSAWVNREVQRFRELGRHDRILALLIEGEPGEAFPSALREIRQVAGEGDTSERLEEVEPLASDVRGGGARRRRIAKLRILANLFALTFDDLYQRERRRRRQRTVFGAALAVVLAAGAAIGIGAGVRAKSMRQANEFAQAFDAALDERQFTPGRVKSLEDLLARWRTLSPLPADAATARLNRALADDVNDLMHRPYLSASQIQEIRSELSLLARRDAEGARPLDAALQARLRTWETSFELQAPFEPIDQRFGAGWFRKATNGKTVRFDPPGNWDDRKDLLTSDLLLRGNGQIDLVLESTWEQRAGYVGLAFGPNDSSEQPSNILHDESKGYRLIFHVHRAGEPDPWHCSSIEAARKDGGWVEMAILQDGQIVKNRVVDVSAIRPGSLHLTGTHEADRVRFQVNDLAPLECVQVFPAADNDAAHPGLILGRDIWVRSLSIAHQPLPPEPSPLETGDSLLAARKTSEALAAYQSAAGLQRDPVVRQQARVKQALCLIALKRASDAADILHSVLNEPGDRWPVTAGLQLCALYMKEGRNEEAETVLDQLTVRYPAEQLALLATDDVRDTVQRLVDNAGTGLSLLMRQTPEGVRRVEQFLRFETLADAPPTQLGAGRLYLSRALQASGDYTAALPLLLRNLDASGFAIARPDDDGMVRRSAEDFVCLSQMRHAESEALQKFEQYDRGGNPQYNNWILMQKARLHAAMGMTADAERELREARAKLIKLSPGGFPRIDADLMLGFLCEDRGDHAAALDFWKKGKAAGFPDHEAKSGEVLTEGLAGCLSLMSIGCLSDISDLEIDRVVTNLTATRFNASKLTVFKKNVVKIPAAVVRKAFADPRGRTLSRAYAFRSEPVPKVTRELCTLLLEYYLREGSLGGQQPNTDQATLYAQSASLMLQNLGDDRIKEPQVLQLVFAWKGVTGPLGWAGVAPLLDPPVRCRLGYILALHYGRTGKPVVGRKLLADLLPVAEGDEPLLALMRAELASSGASLPVSRVSPP